MNGAEAGGVLACCLSPSRDLAPLSMYLLARPLRDRIAADVAGGTQSHGLKSKKRLLR